MKSAVTVLLLICFLCSCSQMKNVQIKKADGYFQKFAPGILPQDGHGNHRVNYPDTLYTIYIELKGPAPEWQKAWTATSSYQIRTMPVVDSLVVVGVKKGSSEKIQLKPSKQDTLCRLQLLREREITKAPKNVKEGSVLLQGRFNSKQFFYTVTSLTELAAPHYQ